MAQKKAKKKKNVKTEINEGLNASYEFMVITGYELANDKVESRSGNSPAASRNDVVRPFSKVVIKFDFGRFKFYQTSLVWFYGTLGKFSKVVWSRYGAMMEEARFRFIPFKYYKSFQKELLKNPKLTSEEFAKSM